MITKNELKEIARLTRLKLHQQEKHYIQILILNSIYSFITDELVFKGGTALFLFSGLPRFSEDLDFTQIKQINKEILLDNVKKDLERFGIKNKISNMKENNMAISFRIDAEGPIFTKEIEKCYAKVEISKRESIDNFLIRKIKSNYPDIPDFSVCVSDEKEILAEKVRAILTRNQARDLFDLHFLLKKNVSVDLSLINKKLAYYGKKFDKREFIKKINVLGELWTAELEPFVMGNLPDFKEVKGFVSKTFSSLD